MAPLQRQFLRLVTDRGPALVQMIRLSKVTHFSAAVALVFNFHSPAVHADFNRDEEGANDFNYVYGTVLGTGYYKSQVERLFILRAPLSHQLPKSWGNTRLLVPAASAIATAVAKPGSCCSSREPTGNLIPAGLSPGRGLRSGV